MPIQERQAVSTLYKKISIPMQKYSSIQKACKEGGALTKSTSATAPHTVTQSLTTKQRLSHTTHIHNLDGAALFHQ